MAKILVVEDSKVVNKIMTDVLTERGDEIKSCYNVEDAIEIVKDGGFALVITDIIMPGKDGTELVEYMHHNIAPVDLPPILAISGGSADTVGANTMLQSIEDQVDRVLVKPFKKEEFLEVIDALLAG